MSPAQSMTKMKGHSNVLFPSVHAEGTTDSIIIL